MHFYCATISSGLLSVIYFFLLKILDNVNVFDIMITDDKTFNKCNKKQCKRKIYTLARVKKD